MSGAFSTLMFCFMSSTMTGTSLMGFFADKQVLVDNWRLVLGLPAIVCVLRLVFYLAIFRIEPAVYYLEKYGNDIDNEDNIDRVKDA